MKLCIHCDAELSSGDYAYRYQHGADEYWICVKCLKAELGDVPRRLVERGLARKLNRAMAMQGTNGNDRRSG